MFRGGGMAAAGLIGAVTLLGSGMLVTGHWRNGQTCRGCVH